MRILMQIGCRIYQQAMRAAMYLLPWREPALLSSLAEVAPTLSGLKKQKPLVVTDEGIVRAGLWAHLAQALGDMDYSLYTDTATNPTLDNIDAARAQYLRDGCDCLIALGGGSPMDCAKAVGASIARPRKALSALRGQLKVLRKIPPLVAIPTTAGTGSETTLAAVVLDTKTHEKYAINDPVLIPRYAVLDPALTVGLPPALTAQTGMDALTHAIEAFIGRSNTSKTRCDSLDAVFLIHTYLPRVWRDGQDLDARRNMQWAAFRAGAAFTRAYVGYVHAIAHQLGAIYAMPHGLANAILLPHVLAYYGKAAHKPLAELYEAFGGDSTGGASMPEKAGFVLKEIRTMNETLDIPGYVECIRPEDIERIVEGAYREATPLYPVPRLLDRQELTELVRMVSVPPPSAEAWL